MPETLLLLALAFSGEVDPLPSRFASDTLLVSVVTAPDTVRTGDAFLLRVRLRAPVESDPDWVPHPPDTLPVTGGIEPRGAARVERVDAGPEPLEWALEYPLQALRPGLLPLPPLRLRTEGGATDVGGGRSGTGEAPTDGEWLLLPLGSVRVHPRLPKPDVEVRPSAPLPAPPPPWDAPDLLRLALLLAGAAGGGAGWLALRRRGPVEADRERSALPSRATHREAARAREALRILATSFRGRELGGEEAREVAGAVVGHLRTVLAHDLGLEAEGLTTSEIVARIGEEGANPSDVPILAELLGTGDRVRFGLPGSPGGEAFRLLRCLDEWLEHSHA